MRKKVWLVLAVAAILAVPTGIALATVDMDQWVQDRAQDRAQCVDCPTFDETITPVVAVQNQDQLRNRVHDPAVCDGSGEQLRAQKRLHVAEHSGQGIHSRQPQADGMTGPYRDGPLDGSGPLHSPLDGVRS